MSKAVVKVPILKGIGKRTGDGWKDTTQKGEIVFVWNRELPSPYTAGQYPRIGKEHWSASTEQYDFTPATLEEIEALFHSALPSPKSNVEGIALTDWERLKMLQSASANALTYMGHHARGGLKPHEIEEMERWEALSEKLRHPAPQSRERVSTTPEKQQ